MAQPIDPKSGHKSQSSGAGGQAKPSVDAFYHRAVAAFKAQNYDLALACFQRLGQLPPSSPYYLKALIGQVRVHQRLGQADQARRLCRQRLDSPSPQVRQWANRTLDQLAEKTAAPILSNPPENTGSTGISPASTSPASTSPQGTDLSGFVPLEKAEGVPPRLPAPAPQSGVAKSSSAKSSRDGAAPETTNLVAEPISPPDGLDPDPRSLFHYQQLNQSPGADPDGADLTSSEALTAAPADPVPPRASSPPKSASPRPSPQRPRPQDPLPKWPLMLWLGQGLTAIALGWAINWAFHFTLRTVDGLLRWVRWPVRLSLPDAYQSYTVWVVAGLVLLALTSPWLIDFALTTWYRQRPLSIRQLQTHRPGTLRLLRQTCRQQGWQMPELRLIADSAPLCFSYGWLPRNSRIVISQGLLDQTSDEVLTALYGYELARMVNGSLPVLSAIGLLLLLLHSGYRWLAQRADGLAQPLARGLVGSTATVLYGLFWLLRQGVLWLSRLCCRWADRRAVALTQPPDSMPSQMLEAWVQVTEAIAAHLQQHSVLHPLHTSLEVLMPVSSRQAIAPGSVMAASTGDRADVLSTLVTVDGLNPYRQWLRVNASHEPLGERLLWLNQQALQRNQPGLALPSQPTAPVAKVSLPLLLLQKGPLAGLLAGGGLAMGLWFVGGIVNRLGWQRLSWLYQDPSILWGGLWLGLGLGLLLRINGLFPESARARSTDTVAALLQQQPSLPVQGQPVTLRGKLRGLGGTGNWGCQDLYLDDSSGLVKLVNPVALGSLQGLLQSSNHPFNWIGRMVTVTGWSRYGGGMLWVDINQVQLDQRHRFFTYGPLWATALSVGSCLIGILTIFRGG